MSKLPRLPSAIEGVPADFRSMFAHAPSLMTSFFQLYSALWSTDVDVRLKELIRVRTARLVDCFL
jgi:hypothetical protein